MIKNRIRITSILTLRKASGHVVSMNQSGYSSAVRSLSELSHDELVSRFRRLDPAKNGTAEEARQSIGKLFRGVTLLKHALEWNDPSVGRAGKSAAIRGQQWRLVMSYSGYEQVEDAIFGESCHNKTTRKNALARIRLQHRLPGPILTQQAIDYIEERDKDGGKLFDFLGIQKSKRDRFHNWLLGGVADEPCGTERAVFISAQLRHLVAHGALSADRTKKLGLETAFEAAPLILHEIAGGLLEILIQNNNQKQP
jgi:hypothetical protein